MGRLRHKCGGAGLRRLAFGLALTAILCNSPLTCESIAWAGFLDGGLRPKDGDRVRTVRPQPPGASKRILAPGEQRQTSQTRTRPRQSHAWFWRTYSPARSAGSSARWRKALETLQTRRASGQGGVARTTVEGVFTNFAADIARAAARHNVSPALLAAVITVESRGRLRAVSPKGAQGLMQLIPATAQRFHVSDPFNSADNISGGAAYLDWLLREFNGDALLALAGYNAGEGAVRRHRGVPPYAETRDYVVKVLDAVAALEPSCADAFVSPRSTCPMRPGS